MPFSTTTTTLLFLLVCGARSYEVTRLRAQDSLGFDTTGLFDGDYDFDLYLPDCLAADTCAKDKHPVLLVLHAGFGTKEQQVRFFFGGSNTSAVTDGVEVLVDEEEFVMVAPNGRLGRELFTPPGAPAAVRSRYWASQPSCCGCGYGAGSCADEETGLYEPGSRDEAIAEQDVSFFDALIDFTIRNASNYAVDKDRVFILGASNGGFQGLKLACDHADVFAGVVEFIATMDATWENFCKPTQPVHVLFSNYDDGFGILAPPFTNQTWIGTRDDTAIMEYISTFGFPKVGAPVVSIPDNILQVELEAVVDQLDLLAYRGLATTEGADAWATLNGCAGGVDFTNAVDELDNTINENDGLHFNNTPAEGLQLLFNVPFTPGLDVEVFEAPGCPLGGSVTFWFNKYPTELEGDTLFVPESALNWTSHTQNLLAWFTDNPKPGTAATPTSLPTFTTPLPTPLF